jgi:7-cyano-7-deazaguanine synthase in queuosine biosynthesis
VANAVYVPFRNGVLGSHATRVDLDADTIKAALIDHGTDTPNTTTDDFYNDISAGLVGALSSALANKTIGTVAAGVFDADNVTFSAVSGNSVESVNLLKDTGNAATSDLIAYFDTATGLPVTPNGGDITVTWAAGGIFTF